MFQLGRLVMFQDQVGVDQLADGVVQFIDQDGVLQFEVERDPLKESMVVVLEMLNWALMATRRTAKADRKSVV